MEPIRLPTEAAVPLALIVNELVTNALKYGRPVAGPATIHITFGRIGSGQMQLVVTDNGPGFHPKNPEQRGLGTRLVNTFVRQLSAQMTSCNSDPGYAVTITFQEQAATQWRHES